MEISNSWPAPLGQKDNVQGECHFSKLPVNPEITEASGH